MQNLNCQLTVINADFKLQILSICICHLMLGPSFPPINYSIYFPLHLILPNQPSLLFFSFSLMHFFSSNHNLFSLIFSSHIPQFFPLFTTPINFMAPSHFLFVFFSHSFNKTSPTLFYPSGCCVMWSLQTQSEGIVV